MIDPITIYAVGGISIIYFLRLELVNAHRNWVLEYCRDLTIEYADRCKRHALREVKSIPKEEEDAYLEEYKKNKRVFVMAPHPHYPYKHCLGGNFLKYIDLFDGTEFCHYYTWYFNPYNKKAVKEAKKFNKPMIGTSDCHKPYQFNKTYSLVDANKDIDSVLGAIRNNKIEIRTKPLSSINCARVVEGSTGI